MAPACGRKKADWFEKVLGAVNPADIGTKILTAADVWANLAPMGMKPVAGKAKSQKEMIEDGNATVYCYGAVQLSKEEKLDQREGREGDGRMGSE